MGKRVLCTLKKFLKIPGAHHPGVWLTVNGTGLEKNDEYTNHVQFYHLQSFYDNSGRVDVNYPAV